LAKPEDVVHTTTNNLVDFICDPKEGHLFSLDMDSEHIRFAQELLGRDAPVTFVLGDSVHSLKILFISQPISVLCLDSKEFDEYHMVHEYNAIKHALADKHFVLVDDIHNPNSVKYKKMVPLLKELGYASVEVPTPTGMLVASKGYPLWSPR